MTPLNSRFLLEALPQTVLVVDVQPAYANYIYFDLKKLSRKLRSSRSVMVLYNGRDSGLTDDDESDVSEFLFGRNGSQRARYFDKGYAFFRDLMDNGVDEDFLVELARHLLFLGLNDARELDDEDPFIVQLRDEHGYEKDDIGFFIPELARRLQNIGPVAVLGGGVNECLAEVLILLKAMRVPFTVVDEFVY